MQKKRTRESLGIFWEGEEVDGLTVYAYHDAGNVECVSVTKNACEYCSLSERSSALSGSGWTVCISDIKVDAWPQEDEWRPFVRRILVRAIESGARVAWCGLEGGFVEPPDLFAPEYMSGSVWAALTSEGKFSLHAGLEEEFRVLSDDELAELQRYTFAP